MKRSVTSNDLLRTVCLSAIVLASSLHAGVSAAADSNPAICRVHVVGPGHSLWKIAKRYNISVDVLRTQNGLDPQAAVQPGDRLLVPPKGATKCVAESATKVSDQAAKKPGADKSASSKPSPKKPEPEAREKPAETKTPKGNENAGPSETKPKKTSGFKPVKPLPSTQVQTSVEERGGINPCNTPDPGFGVYDPWSRAPSMGQMIMPQKGGITADGQFDVMFHFHGHEPARKEWVQAMDGAVLMGVTLGIGSGPYESTFRDPNAFPALVKSVEKAMAAKTGKKNARVRRVGLSAWSAGYGAVGEILRDDYGKKLVDTVILLDGLHCGYNGDSLNDIQLEPFLAFAKQAAARRKLMFVSHSSIIPPDYASTTETTNYLIHELGGKPQKAKRRDTMGLQLISRYAKGNFHARGYTGNDKMDHCAHLGLYREILSAHVKKRWKSPKGRKK